MAGSMKAWMNSMAMVALAVVLVAANSSQTAEAQGNSGLRVNSIGQVFCSANAGATGSIGPLTSTPIQLVIRPSATNLGSTIVAGTAITGVNGFFNIVINDEKTAATILGNVGQVRVQIDARSVRTCPILAIRGGVRQSTVRIIAANILTGNFVLGIIGGFTRVA